MKTVKKIVQPMLMQLSAPEYMCPECGNKFYLQVVDGYIVFDNKPCGCSDCGVQFDWCI